MNLKKELYKVEEVPKIEGECTSQAFFIKIKNTIKETLSISDDLAYLLLKKFGRDKTQAIQAWEKSKDSILESFRILQQC